MFEDKLRYSLAKMKLLNVKVTPQRVAVLKYLLNSEQHPTANEIYRDIENEFPYMSPATVYNNLNVLCENGLVRELTFGSDSSRFDGNTANHYHIICNDCGKITDVHYPILKELETFAEQVTKFKVSHHRLVIYGMCATCSG